MSTIKRYFNSLYDASDSFSTFTVGQSLDDVYVAEATNKIARLQDYRNMCKFQEIGQTVDTMCYTANIPDENNKLITIDITSPILEPKDIETIRNAIQDYLNLFDFDNNFEEFFRIFLTEGQLCWENIIAKDDLEEGIIGINIIPNDAYEFCYDLKTRKKIGIMITNTLADNFYLADALGIRAINGATVATGGPYTSLNCYEELLDEKCIVLPFEQLTYMDTGYYSDDSRQVYSILERAKRPFNQLRLIEDAIMIYRVSRSPEKYVFNVDIGKMGKARGEMEVAKLKKQFGTKKVYDPNTGTIGKAYDPMQMSENFWFCKGADSQGIQVSPLQSQNNFGNLDDLEYFQKKLLRSLNMPIARFFPENTQIISHGDDTGITAEELHFSKFLISMERNFAKGLLNGAITHLKYTGLWDIYRLTSDMIKIIINPPIEYVTYRRQKLLESKVTMMKTVLGDEAITNIFSSELALELFMGWDKDQIERNKQLKFKELVESAKMEYLKTKISETGTLDIAPGGGEEGEEGEGGGKTGRTFAEILQDGLDQTFLETGGEGGEGGGGESGEDMESGMEDDEFSDISTGDEMAADMEEGGGEGGIEEAPMEEAPSEEPPAEEGV